MTTVPSSRDAVDVVEIEPHQNFPGSNTLFSEKVVFNDDINYVENLVSQFKHLIENAKKFQND